MTVSTVFGPAVSATQLEAAVLSTLKFWMPTYLCWVESLTGRDHESLPQVRSWTVVNEFVKMPEDQLPAVVLEAPGTVGAPVKGGDGLITVTWELNVGVICSAATREATNALAKDYATALAELLLNHRSLGGVATGLDYQGEAYTAVPQERLRMAAVAQVDFHVQIDGARSVYGGPKEPGCTQPDLGIVEEVDIDAYATRAGDDQPPDLMHLVHRRAT